MSIKSRPRNERGAEPDTFYPPGYGGEYKVSGFFGRKRGGWNLIFMISGRCVFSYAGMLFAVSQAVRNIGLPIPWLGVYDKGRGIFYEGIGHDPDDAGVGDGERFS